MRSADAPVDGRSLTIARDRIMLDDIERYVRGVEGADSAVLQSCGALSTAGIWGLPGLPDDRNRGEDVSFCKHTSAAMF